jgi:hypothetical protein
MFIANPDQAILGGTDWLSSQFDGEGVSSDDLGTPLQQLINILAWSYRPLGLYGSKPKLRDHQP